MTGQSEKAPSDVTIVYISECPEEVKWSLPRFYSPYFEGNNKTLSVLCSVSSHNQLPKHSYFQLVVATKMRTSFTPHLAHSIRVAFHLRMHLLNWEQESLKPSADSSKSISTNKLLGCCQPNFDTIALYFPLTYYNEGNLNVATGIDPPTRATQANNLCRTWA